MRKRVLGGITGVGRAHLPAFYIFQVDDKLFIAAQADMLNDTKPSPRLEAVGKSIIAYLLNKFVLRLITQINGQNKVMTGIIRYYQQLIIYDYLLIFCMLKNLSFVYSL